MYNTPNCLHFMNPFLNYHSCLSLHTLYKVWTWIFWPPLHEIEAVIKDYNVTFTLLALLLLIHC